MFFLNWREGLLEDAKKSKLQRKQTQKIKKKRKDGEGRKNVKVGKIITKRVRIRFEGVFYRSTKNIFVSRMR